MTVARSQTVLVVDDEPRIRRFVRTELEAQGYRVLLAENGAQGLELIETEAPDLVVLDLIMPGIDGFETLERLRELTQVPVILLTAKGGDRDKVRGLDLGADDYLTKPFNPEELSARIRAVLRRTRAPATSESHRPLVYGDLLVDLDQRRVLVGDREVALSPTEWQLLYYLASNAGKVILHEDLLAMTWGPEYRNDLQYLRVWISRLRRKLRDDPVQPRFIRTVPGVGYMVKAS
ncbi:MAG: response regulator transcription factor [Chloroflexi bacterium]|nr:response regulator transcription factor [Chloroflexota bacterium]